jgi:hypothetical protein
MLLVLVVPLQATTHTHTRHTSVRQARQARTVSASNSGLGVVRSLSPLKMELAPAKNMSACSPAEKLSRPGARVVA